MTSTLSDQARAVLASGRQVVCEIVAGSPVLAIRADEKESDTARTLPLLFASLQATDSAVRMEIRADWGDYRPLVDEPLPGGVFQVKEGRTDWRRYCLVAASAEEKRALAALVSADAWDIVWMRDGEIVRTDRVENPIPPDVRNAWIDM